MTSRLVAYVRKGCKTCARALAVLEERDVPFERVELFEDPPSQEELRHLVEKLGLRPRDLLRPRDRTYRELNLTERQMSDDDLLRLMAEHPDLLKRPILVRGNRAVLGIRREDLEAFLEGRD